MCDDGREIAGLGVVSRGSKASSGFASLLGCALNGGALSFCRAGIWVFLCKKSSVPFQNS